MTTREFAEKYGVSVRRVQVLVKQGRIKASVNPNNGYWDIDEDAVYPIDERISYFNRRFRTGSRKPVCK